MNSFGISVLSVLNQEYHEEGDDGCGSVDDQLPSVGKMKSGASDEPDGNHKHSSSKRPGAAEYERGMARKNAERVADAAKEIAFSFFFLWFFALGFVQRSSSFRARLPDCAHETSQSVSSWRREHD